MNKRTEYIFIYISLLRAQGIIKMIIFIKYFHLNLFFTFLNKTILTSFKKKRIIERKHFSLIISKNQI